MLLTNNQLKRGDSPNLVPADSPRVPAKSIAVDAVWVSTDLKTWIPREPAFIARDCQINDRCYRRLDPDYFAWLRARMHAVKAAVDASRVPGEVFDELRVSFNEIQVRAIGLFGEAVLLKAVRDLDVDAYRPPLREEFAIGKAAEPAPTASRPESERLARARELVDGIRDQALALGWTMDSLYFCEGYERHPVGPRYGLVCYIRAYQRIGQVTRQSIELIGADESRTRFHNPDVEQPWIRKHTRRVGIRPPVQLQPVELSLACGARFAIADNKGQPIP